MSSRLNLVKSNFLHQEKRIFPRYSLGFLTFKCISPLINKIFMVTDISATGMQLTLRAIGEEEFLHKPLESETKVSGIIHWGREEMPVVGSVRWREGLRYGLRFEMPETEQAKFEDFFSLENIVNKMRPLHNPSVGPGPEAELPNSLKYWFKADGAMELFVWMHDHGGHSGIQLILMEDYIEWQDGKGLFTGKKIDKETKTLSTPLTENEELLIEFDDGVVKEKTEKAQRFFSFFNKKHLPELEIEFLRSRLHL
jgi:hypothetical protein